MILAELNVRHTRRHMPTRRVALGDHYLPTSGAAYGAVLLGAVAADSVDGLDIEQRDALTRFLDDAHGGLSVPRIALRYRLQTDVHGLDRSRHRIVGEGALDGNGRPGVVLELDVHGRAAPQLIGTVMAAAALSPSARRVAFRAVEAALARPGVMPEGLQVRRLFEGVPGARPAAPSPGRGRNGAGAAIDPWRNVPAERRWAMEVLGLNATMAVDRDDIQRRFRRLVRLAHPDQGGAATGAAERIAELSEARELLLTLVTAGSARPAGR